MVNVELCSFGAWTDSGQTVVDLDDSVVSSTKSIHLHPMY